MSESNQPPIYLVSGLSGAGRSTCLHVLEDLGYEAVDNLPLSLLPALMKETMASENRTSPIAVGIDIRSHKFNVNDFIQIIGKLQKEAGCSVRLLFMECDDASLISRYNQTRRPHPLAPQETIETAISLERDLLNPLKEVADMVLDSTGHTIWQFRNRLKNMLGDGISDKMRITLMSFSFARAVPRDADLVFDVRFLQNPHYIEKLRPLTGRDQEVQDYIKTDPDWQGFLERLLSLLELTIPRYQAEGKSHLTIAVGCTGGRHRSVYLAEELNRILGEDWPCHLVHSRLESEQV